LIRKILFIFALVLLVGVAGVVSAETNVCCEKTTSGLFCQNVLESSCASNSRAVPTSCESTSYCKQGYCFDSIEGTCSDNVPQLVCNNEGGYWSETQPAQCELGCCTLGDQAAFVTLTRCKSLSSLYGLQTNFNSGIKDETSCILSVAGQEKGACVFDFEFERTCKFTSRADCEKGVGESAIKGEFYTGKLCSAEELGTNCGPSSETTCVDGKDEVYFVDTCGNPTNIYDSSKVNDKEYWSNVKTKEESCGNGKDNAKSSSCGNCNYLLGSYCRESKFGEGSAKYGDYVCADLNCGVTSNGKSYRHGESWCVYEDEGDTGIGKNSVGSRFFKHICINGEEVVEQCADFRQEECIEDEIETSLGTFSQAACRVNRWQDCTAQDNEIDCENSDRRDCIWKSGSYDVVTINASQKGVCVPENTPGLKFWEGAEAQNICAQANAQCVVTFEKGLFGGEDCTENCDCLTKEWEKKHAELCSALGDCGSNINWLGKIGFKKGFEVKKN